MSPSRPLRRLRARRSRGGIALLVVIAAVMFLTTLVTDIDFGARVRFVASAHTRDGAQAYWVANSGMSLYRLVLMGNKQLGKYLTGSGKDFCEIVSLQGISCSDPLLSFLPFLNTGLLRSMLVSGGDIDDEDLDELKATGQASEATTAESREKAGSRFGKQGFLDFTGDFTATVEGEDCKVNVSGLSSHEDPLSEDPLYEMLEQLMSGEENEAWLRERNLTALELIGNLADWVDSDSNVASGNGSYEDNFYSGLASPYLAKNAPFDSTEEIRLVEGWQDAVFERWGDKLTIYGSQKVNITCADREVLKMMLRAYGGLTTDAQVDTALTALDQYKMDGNVIATCDQFSKALSEQQGVTMSSDFSSKCTNRNTVYTVASTGVVGNVQVKITAVIDQSKSDAGRVKYWRVE
jgi:type II secretory pathway component PulK